jgi:putative ABC transport system permease protein
MKQEDKVSARFLADEIKGLGVTATIVPTVFLVIAALILLVLLNRMVRMERTQIGLMKAYGYSNLAVALHYIEYALLLSVLGALGGFVLGQWLAGGMMSLYVQFYKFPLLESRIYPDVLLRAMGVAIGFALIGALLAAYRAAQIHPAEAMRPEAPREAHRVWLERLPGVWRRLGFTWRMIVRNIARNKFRAAINIFGVAVSTALLIMGFFMMDAMDFAMRFQFQRIQREDVRVSFQREQGKQTLHETARLAHVRRAEPLLQYPFDMKSGWRTKEVVVTGVPRASELQKVMTFAGVDIPIPTQGIVLSDRLARTMDVVPGDKVTLKPLMGRIDKEQEVTVTGTAQQFLGAGAYMDLQALSRLLDEPFAMNTALLRIEEGGETALNEQLKDVAGVAAVSFTADAYQSVVDTIQASMAIMTTIQLGFSAIIAFSIIYNVTLVSLSERQRELASLRVLGLTPAEVGGIMYHENTLLGVLGTLAGIPLGMAVCMLLVKAYDTDLYRIPFHIERSTFGVSILMAMACVLVANLAVKRRIRRFDLVEVLKERD